MIIDSLLAPDTLLMPLPRLLARSGLCSRRQAQSWINQGRVHLDGNRVAPDCAPLATFDQVQVDGQPLKQPKPTRLWRMHKPRKCLVTDGDGRGRLRVRDLWPKSWRHIVVVGRLDYDSEGLLLLTNDGQLSRFLEMPATGLKRIYSVEARGDPDMTAIRRLKRGVSIDNTCYRPCLCQPMGREGVISRWRVQLHEGKKHEVRLLLAYAGLDVTRLVRLAYGPWRLGNLEPAGIQAIDSVGLRDWLKGYHATHHRR